jgi:CheY-like chemotaxis protein/DNA-directed RNA polymerase specialized sigma24 family protein
MPDMNISAIAPNLMSHPSTMRRRASPMNNVKDILVGELPYLRRYARALTGSQERGDHYVRVCLETLVAEPKLRERVGGTRQQIYKLFHEVWRIIDDKIVETRLGIETESSRQLERAINELTIPERQILILTSLEEFSLAEAADILAIETVDAERLLARAKKDLTEFAKVDVLIIEDEALIAMAVGDIVEEMGHTVVGVAARASVAIELAERTKPGLVLADIQLEDGSSGIDAVQEILKKISVPVIFITAHPELLLTGETEEPAFLLAKPFEPLALQTAISQALLLRR